MQAELWKALGSLRERVTTLEVDRKWMWFMLLIIAFGTYVPVGEIVRGAVAGHP